MCPRLRTKLSLGFSRRVQEMLPQRVDGNLGSAPVERACCCLPWNCLGWPGLSLRLNQVLTKSGTLRGGNSGKSLPRLGSHHENVPLLNHYPPPDLVRSIEATSLRPTVTPEPERYTRSEGDWQGESFQEAHKRPPKRHATTASPPARLALLCLLEAQIASALPRSLEMLHRRTKSSLICLSTVFEDIIDST